MTWDDIAFWCYGLTNGVFFICFKELCLYLDEERSQNSCSQCGAVFRRDDGDGSSSETNGPTEDYQTTSSQHACDLTNDSTISNNDSSSSSTQGNLSDREDFTRERNLSSKYKNFLPANYIFMLFSYCFP